MYNVAYIPSGTTATGRRPLPEEVCILKSVSSFWSQRKIRAVHISQTNGTKS